MNKIFDYNKKYHVWSSEMNMDLIPTEEEKIYVEEEAKSPEMLNTMINRMGEFILKGYTAPDDGYYAYHNDWSTSPTLISRVLGAQFFLNDVEVAMRELGISETSLGKKKRIIAEIRVVIFASSTADCAFLYPISKA